MNPSDENALAANDVRPFLHFEASDAAFSQRHFQSSVGPDRVRHRLERDDRVGIGPDDDQTHGVHCTDRTRDSAADALSSVRGATAFRRLGGTVAL